MCLTLVCINRGHNIDLPDRHRAQIVRAPGIAAKFRIGAAWHFNCTNSLLADAIVDAMLQTKGFIKTHRGYRPLPHLLSRTRHIFSRHTSKTKTTNKPSIKVILFENKT